LRASGSSRRDRRSARVGAPLLVPAALALAAAIALWLSWDRLGAVGVSLEPLDAQVRRALAQQGRAHLEDVYGFRAGGTAELTRVAFGDVTVQPEGRRAEVVAVVDAEGRVAWRDQAASVGYVGRERFAMEPCSIALWCADGRQFSGLRGVLTTLFRRQDAFNGADAAAYGRIVSDRYQGEGGKAALVARLGRDLGSGPRARMRVRAWQIRVEQGRASVGEDYEIRIGDASPRTLRARFELTHEDDRWTIVSGL
jgi:hypothetical protein